MGIGVLHLIADANGLSLPVRVNARSRGVWNQNAIVVWLLSQRTII